MRIVNSGGYLLSKLAIKCNDRNGVGKKHYFIDQQKQTRLQMKQEGRVYIR